MKRKGWWAFLGLLLALGGMVYVFDHIKLIDARAIAYPRLAKVPYVGRYFQPQPIDPAALLQEELTNQQEGLAQVSADQEEQGTQLATREAELKKKEEELLAATEAMARKQAEIQAQTARYEEAEGRYKKLVEYFSSMPPQLAAGILGSSDTATGTPKIEDETVIEILMRMEGATAGLIISLMPPDRASVIVRKIGQ